MVTLVPLIPFIMEMTIIFLELSTPAPVPRKLYGSYVKHLMPHNKNLKSEDEGE